MTDRNFKKLQRVQNTLARVVLRAGKFEHNIHSRADSTSLAAGQTTGPVQTGFNNFQRLATQQPHVLARSFNYSQIHNPSRNLRSSSQHLLSVGYMRTSSSSRCFKHSAAINWNALLDIRACDSVINVF